MNAQAAVILLGDAAGGTAGVAAILKGDAPSDVGSPPAVILLHRAEEGPVLSAAGALQCCRGMNAHAAVIPLGDAAGGTAGVAAIVAGDAATRMGSPLHHAEEGPVLSAADAGVGSLRYL